MPRRAPAGRMTRRAAIRGIAAVTIGGVTGAAVHGYANERRALGVTYANLPVSGLPRALAGLRLGLLTDLHHGRFLTSEMANAAVDRLMAERPDLVVLGGDYVNVGDRRYIEPAAEALGRLSAPHGVFAALGNHDDDRHMPAALARRGITVLMDARTRIALGGEALEIAGLRYWTQRVEAVSRVLRGATATTVLVAHDPRRLREAAALAVPLVLSGHTHGGQVVLPGLGAVAARRFPVVAGVGRQQDTTIFVSRGVGTVLVPVRLNCPPEVALLTLEAAGRI